MRGVTLFDSRSVKLSLALTINISQGQVFSNLHFVCLTKIIPSVKFVSSACSDYHQLISIFSHSSFSSNSLFLPSLLTPSYSLSSPQSLIFLIPFPTPIPPFLPLSVTQANRPEILYPPSLPLPPLFPPLETPEEKERPKGRLPPRFRTRPVVSLGAERG